MVHGERRGAEGSGRGELWDDDTLTRVLKKVECETATKGDRQAERRKREEEEDEEGRDVSPRSPAQSGPSRYPSPGPSLRGPALVLLLAQ